jgi:antitoxin PrlF
MTLAHSRLTAQGQVSIPAAVRRKMGIGPGSVIEWDEDGSNIIVRRSGLYTSLDAHHVLFPEGPPPPRTVEEMKLGIQELMRRKYPRPTNARD